MTQIDLTAAPLPALRTTLKTAIATATGYDVYLYGSPNLSTPCVVIEPNGWAPAMAAKGLVAVTVKVTCLYNTADGATSSDGAEEMARRVYLACAAAGWLATDVPPPGQITWGDPPRGFVGIQMVLGRTTDLN